MSWAKRWRESGRRRHQSEGMETVRGSDQNTEEQRTAGQELRTQRECGKLAVWGGGGWPRRSGQRKPEGRSLQPSIGVGAAWGRSRAGRLCAWCAYTASEHSCPSPWPRGGSVSPLTGPCSLPSGHGSVHLPGGIWGPHTLQVSGRVLG